LNRKTHTRPIRFGPGMILLSAALAIVGFNAWNATESTSRYFEPDAGGKLREVSRPSITRTDPPPLFKPEPELILKSERIALNASQKSRIEAIDRRWRNEKAQRLAQLDASIPKRNPTKKTSVAVVNAELADYSALSRAYDAARADSWSRALAALTVKQRKEIHP